jgi:hypothetical protein
MCQKSATAAKSEEYKYESNIHFQPLRVSLQFLPRSALHLIPDLMACDVVELSAVMKMNGVSDEPVVRGILFLNI